SRGLSELVAASEDTQPQFRSFTTAEGLSDNSVETMAEDRDGNLWLGSLNGGGGKKAQDGGQNLHHAEGRDRPGELFNLPDRAGQTCCFLRARQNHEFISCFDGQQVSGAPLDLPAKIWNLGWGWGQEALQNRAGEWWAPTGQGLFRFPATEQVAQLAHTPPR